MTGIYISSDAQVEISTVKMCDVPLSSKAWEWALEENMVKTDMEKAWEVIGERVKSKDMSVELLIS